MGFFPSDTGENPVSFHQSPFYIYLTVGGLLLTLIP